NFETRFTTKYQINNVISNYNEKSFLITSTYGIFNDSLQILDSMTKGVWNNIMQEIWDEPTPSNGRYYGYTLSNPQINLFIPLNKCFSFNFYSSKGYTQDGEQ